jgi:hypothetical protein
MKKFTAAAGLSAATAVVLCAHALAQGAGAASQSTPVFRAGTTLVEFTVVATDRDGRPVTDLTQNDITVVQSGKTQPVAFFRFEGSAFGPDPAEAKREPIAPGIFTNRPEYSPGANSPPNSARTANRWCSPPATPSAPRRSSS